MAINGKNLEHRRIDELMAIVRGDLWKLDSEGLIDEGRCVKTVMYCNEKLGLSIREVREVCLKVEGGKARLPLDFEKIWYARGLRDLRSIELEMRNPFDNGVDADVLYEAKIASGKIGPDTPVTVTIKRQTNVTVHEFQNWIELDVDTQSKKYCYGNSPLYRHRGKPCIRLNDDSTLDVPFEEGLVYVMYVANLKDEDGYLLFPFHPVITPWYEWCVKEKIIQDALFNDEGNYAPLLQECKRERGLAWIDAYNACTDPRVGHHIQLQRKRELEFYNQYFKYFQT